MIDHGADGEEGLSGKLLIAMPGMGDPRFDGTVIYMCAHNEEGALGFVVNRKVKAVTPRELFEQLDIEVGETPPTDEIHYGGPVETSRGFVLHSTDFHLDEATMEVDEAVSMTASREVLEAMASGEGPERAMIALGYAGWSGGQLESELQRNGWLTCDADDEIVFHLDDDAKWAAALAKLGVDPALLSGAGGSA